MLAISPLIAAVILIAFVIAVAGIVGVFFTSFTRTTTAGIEQQTRGAVACSGVYIDLLTVRSETGGNLTIVARNPSTNSITVESAAYNTGQAGSLIVITIPPGAVGATGIPSNSPLNLTGINPSSVTVFGFCLSTGGNLSISGSCSKGQSCWQIS